MKTEASIKVEVKDERPCHGEGIRSEKTQSVELEDESKETIRGKLEKTRYSAVADRHALLMTDALSPSAIIDTVHDCSCI